MTVGIVGAGGMGSVHSRHYRRIDGVELVIFDEVEEKARVLASAHEADVAESLGALIDRCDIVDVCLPTDAHRACALAAVSAGRHVFVEKPIAGTLEDAAEIISASDKAGVKLSVGQVVRFFPEFKQANKLVREGKLGRPAAARTRRGGGAPKADWFLDHARSGGVIVDLAVHDFDWLRWTLGEVTHLYSRSVGIQDGLGLDYALTTLSFDSGAVAHVEATWMDPAGFRVTFEVCGSDGMVQYDSRSVPTLRTHQTSGVRSEAPLSPVDDPYFNQLSAFVGACRGENPLAVTGYDGFMALSIALSALESARTGKVVKPVR
ncbi:MAG: Gfo/Idh/MocA family oxidoreductase [Fimbriimonadaceae bacterium]